MSIYTNPLDEVFNSIAKQGVTLVPSEYHIGPPIAIPVENGFDNTSFELVSKDLQSTYSGRITLTYHRLKLDDLALQAALIVPAQSVSTTRDVYKLVNRHFGTVFTDDDIVIRDLTAEEKELPSTIRIEAKEGSYGWTGSVEVSTRAGGYILSEHVVKLNLGGYDYPGSRVSRPFGHIYSYWRDFTTQYDALQQVVLGDDPENMEIIRSALQEVTKDKWLLEGRTRYALQGAKVIDIAEPFLERSEVYNSRYDHAIKVQLDDDFSLGMGGYVVLHYSKPVTE